MGEFFELELVIHSEFVHFSDHTSTSIFETVVAARDPRVRVSVALL
jgi:hypothetical protein